MRERLVFNLGQALSRVTVNHRFIPEIDGLRFLAIFPVVCLHLSTQYVRNNPIDLSREQLKGNNWLFDVLERGSMGVNLFFVISGFILALPFAQYYFLGAKKISLKKYYLRRLTRLEPPFVICILLIFLFFFLFAKSEIRSEGLLATLTYSHMFFYGEWSWINPVTWSLETEVQFYILAPMLFMLYGIKNSITRNSFLFFGAILICYFMYSNRDSLHEFHLSKSLLVYVSYFLNGLWLASWYTQSEFLKDKSKFIYFDLLFLLGFFDIYWSHYLYRWYAPILQNIGIVFVFIGIFRGKICNTLFTAKWIVIIGGMCYSIYLLHYAIISFIVPKSADILYGESFYFNYFIQFVLIFPLVLVGSSLFFIFFEKPFMYPRWYLDFPRGYFKRLFK